MKLPLEILHLIRRLEKEANDADWAGDAPLADELRKQIAMLRLKKELGTTHETDY